MGDFCVIKTCVKDVLWPRTQLGDGPGVKNRNQGGSTLPPGGPVVELTGHMFFSYPMGDFCVIKTCVQSVLWARTQLGEGP